MHACVAKVRRADLVHMYTCLRLLFAHWVGQFVSSPIPRILLTLACFPQQSELNSFPRFGEINSRPPFYWVAGITSNYPATR